MWCTKLQMQLHLSYQWPPSPSSLCIFVFPTPLHLCSRMWHARFCGLSVSASHFFIIPHSIDSSASSNAPRDGPDLSHLGSDGCTDGRQDVQHQPIRTSLSSLCQGEEEKVIAADRGGRRRNGSLHFPFPPVEEIKHPPEELRSDARHWLLIISTWNWNQTGSLHNQSLQLVSAEISFILHPPTNSFIHSSIHLPIHLFIQLPIHDKPTLPKPITKPSEQKHVTLVS